MPLRMPLLIGLIAMGAFANTLPNGFAMNDRYNIIEHQKIRALRNVPAMFLRQWGPQAGQRQHDSMNYRPLVSATFAVEYQLWGLSPIGYHLSNVVLHVLLCALLVVLFFRLTNKPVAAVLGALVFALHPVHTEPVNLISYRTELLVGICIASAMLIYLQHRWRLSLRVALIALLFIVGLLSKENAATLPGWLVLLELLAPPQFTSKRQRLLRCAVTVTVLLVCFAGYVALRESVLQPRPVDFFGGLSPGLRALSVMKLFRFYVQLLIVPWPMLPFYDWTVLPPATSPGDALAWLGIALYAVLGATMLFCWRRAPLVSLAIGWFLGALVPVMHIVPLPIGAAERHLYSSSIGLCLLGGVGLAHGLKRRPRIFAVLTAAALVAMLVATLERNTHWKSDLTLQRQAVADFPRSFNARLNLGKLELALGNTERAVQHFRAAEKSWPGLRVTASWLAGALLDLGRRDEARAVLRRAMDRHGRLPDLVDLQRRATAP